MRSLPFILVALFVVGCGSSEHTVAVGPDGSKMTRDASGNIKVDDGTGNVVSVDAKGDSQVYSDSKGNSVAVKTDADGSTIYKDSKGNEVKIGKDGSYSTKTEQGTASGGQEAVTEADLGMDFYPGSAATGTDLKQEMKGKKSFTSIRTTTDDHRKVAEFYKGKIPSAQVMEIGEMSTVTGDLPGNRKFGVTCTKADGKTQILIQVTEQ